MEKKTIGKFILVRRAVIPTLSRSTITLCGRNEKNEDRGFSWAWKVFVPVVTVYSVNEMRYQPKIKK